MMRTFNWITSLLFLLLFPWSRRNLKFEMARLILRQRERFAQALGQHNIPGLRWLLEGFNYYDRERVKEVGAERAAAEWIVRCGGSVKFDRIDDAFSDYNALIKRCAELDPRRVEDDVRVVMIDATDSSVTGYGCRHFQNLRGIEDVRFVRCKNLHDFGLEFLANAVGDRLSRLQVHSCSRITEFGLAHLKKCTALKSLSLADLRHVHGKEKILKELEKALPQTDIKFP